MDRSLGFGSTTCYSIALIRLAFASASALNAFTSQHIVTRRSVLQKVRDHTLSRAFSACKHMVSGSLSLPSRGSFHRSLTVLCSIGHYVVFSLTRWSSRVHTGLHVSCATLDTPRVHNNLNYGAITLFRLPFQICSSIVISSHAGVRTP